MFAAVLFLVISLRITYYHFQKEETKVIETEMKEEGESRRGWRRKGKGEEEEREEEEEASFQKVPRW